MTRYVCIIALWLVLAVSPASAEQFASSHGMLKVVTVASGLKHPWSLAFLPDGRMLVSERPGRLRIVTSSGKISAPLKAVPKVFAEGQGGLLDIALDPDFSRNHQIYISYAEGNDAKASTAVAQAILHDDRLEKVKVIFRQLPKVEGDNHWGSRLAFARDGSLFITLGERYDYRDKAQELTNHFGKVVRIQTDGTPARDNPFLKQAGALPEIWSLGHRNMQGAVLHPSTGELWTAEHGARGGDEINISKAGKNYGWPEVSYGSHYSGWPIADDHAARGFVEPVYHWTPSVSPSGMMFYASDRFPSWQGDLFIGALSGRCLIRLDIQKGKVIRVEHLLQDLEERIRDVREGPDGLIYLLTDSEHGRILRLEPAA